MRAMLRRLTRAACISVHAPDGSHSYVAIFFILVLPNTEESSREPRTPLRSLRVGLLGMWGFLRGIGLVIRRQEFSPAHITITVESAKVGAPCPSCGRVSRSRHSSYTRLLMDLPADGRTVNIQLLVRR